MCTPADVCDDRPFTLRTLTLSVKATIRAAEKCNDKAPDYRIFTGQAECGAAWRKTSNEGREYLLVKLADPTFPAPIYASAANPRI